MCVTEIAVVTPQDEVITNKANRDSLKYTLYMLEANHIFSHLLQSIINQPDSSRRK